MALPPMELVRWTVFDTRKLPEKQAQILTFFQNPNITGTFHSNMHASGYFPYPECFFLFGLLLNMYSTEDDGASLVRVDGIKERTALLGECILTFEIAMKRYLETPVMSTINGLLPENAPKIYRDMFQVPGIREEVFDELHPHGMSKDIDLKIPEDLKGALVNPEPGDYFYGMCLFRKNRHNPIHIGCQQAFRAQMRWATPPTYNSEEIGQVHFRLSMLGVLARELP